MTTLEMCVRKLGPGWACLQGSRGSVAFISPTGLIIPFNIIEVIGKKGRQVKKILDKDAQE